MYGDLETASKPCEAIQYTLTQRLELERNQLVKRTEELNSALDALRKYPEIQEVLNLVQKVSRF